MDLDEIMKSMEESNKVSNLHYNLDSIMILFGHNSDHFVLRLGKI